jgi:hypothetical protein
MTGFDESSDIVAAFMRRLAPPKKMLPSKWANDNLYLPAEANARPGRIKVSSLQRQMIDAAAEPGIREIIYCCSSQIGKSVSILALLGWSICGEGNGLLLVRPDIADTKSYQADIIEPTFAAKREDYRKAIMSLPEAIGREKAAAEIARLYSAESCPPWRAASILGGLMMDAEIERPKVNRQADNALLDAAVARMRAIVHSHENDDVKAYKALSFAVRMKSIEPKRAFTTCLREVGFDPNKLRAA